VDLEGLDRLIAEEFQAIAALDERHALRCHTHKFDRSHLPPVLLALALLLRLFIVVELAFNAVDSAVEQVDGRPEQIVEIRFKPRVAQCRNQGVEDIGDRAGDHLALWEWPWIGLVVKGTVAEELQFAKDVVSWR